MAVSASTPVPTTEGWLPASKISTSTTVFDQTGAPQPVTGVQLYVPSACYEVHLDDGLAVTGDRHMSFQLQTVKWRMRYASWQKSLATSKYAKKSMKRPLVTKNAAELFKGPLIRADGKTEYSLATAGPAQFPWADLPVPPYVLGFWLGTRTKSGYHWVLPSMDLEQIKKRFRRHGFFIATRKSSGGRLKMEFRPSVKDSFLFANQEIPADLPFLYLLSSVEQRQELLEGLEDARDSVKLKNLKKFSFVSRSWRSIRLRQSLLESLGYKTLMTHEKNVDHYRLTYAKNAKSPVYLRRFLKKVKKVAPVQCAHIKTERPMLVGEGFLAVC